MLILDEGNKKILTSQSCCLAAAFYGYSVAQLTGMALDQINLLSHDEYLIEQAEANAEDRNYLVFPTPVSQW